jgi:hypothetical protein
MLLSCFAIWTFREPGAPRAHIYVMYARFPVVDSLILDRNARRSDCLQPDFTSY